MLLKCMDCHPNAMHVYGVRQSPPSPLPSPLTPTPTPPRDYAQDPQRVQGALTKVAEALGKEGRTKDLSVALYAKWLAEQQAAAAAAQEQEMRRERERPAKKVRSK